MHLWSVQYVQCSQYILLAAQSGPSSRHKGQINELYNRNPPSMKFWVCFCCVAVLRPSNSNSVISWQWYDYEMSRRKPEPTLPPTQAFFNLAHHKGMAWEELAFDDAVTYTKRGNDCSTWFWEIGVFGHHGFEPWSGQINHLKHSIQVKCILDVVAESVEHRLL